MKTRKVKLSIPTKWNELTPDQLRYVARLLTTTEREAVPLRAALKFSGLKISRGTNPIPNSIQFWKGTRRITLHYDVLQKLAKTTSFVAKESLLTANKYPRILNYYGPADGLGNITFDEFESAELAFEKFTKTKHTDDLNTLIATLYRPADSKNTPNSPDYNGDIRIKFNPNTIEARRKWLRFVPYYTRLVIFLWYSGCRNSLHRTFTEVFPLPAKGAVATPSDPLRLTNLINAINLGDVTKNAEIRQTNLYEVLVFLQNQIKTTQKNKERWKK